MAERDYYEVLGVPRGATPDQIKQAYRKLAKQHHPDRNPNDKTAETRFKEVQQAYDVVGDAEKRKLYDQFGHAGVGAGASPGGPQWQQGPGGQRVHTWRSSGGDPIENWEDLFSTFGDGGGGSYESGNMFDQFFRRAQQGRGKGRRAAPEPSAGQDIEQPVTLTFDNAARGTTFEFTDPQNAGTIRVKIPPGVADGQRIRVRGKGRPGAAGGPQGDLYIVTQIQSHPYFRRISNDIYLDLPITIAEAALGARIEIPTLDGRTVLSVPPGTPCGARLRLKQKGIQAPGKPPGDQYAVVKIVPPKTLDEQQRKLIEEFQQASTDNPRADVGW